jgi:aspartyl-tRNA(Asn)/glutamyl-tRNA(Gln) amidotransferase subunit A
MPSDRNSSKRTVLEITADLANGRTSSRQLIEAALAQIADPAGEGARTFVKVYGESARAAADAQDRLRQAGYVASPLAGLPVSLKDLFDVSGERTLAGSKALDDSPPAARDAPVVSRLRAAGAVLIGRTNMTEFAFSGVGINPHYGTARQSLRSPADPGRVVVRCGGVGQRWWRRCWDRHRYRRLGSHPGRALRDRRL